MTKSQKKPGTFGPYEKGPITRRGCFAAYDQKGFMYVTNVTNDGYKVNCDYFYEIFPPSAFIPEHRKCLRNGIPCVATIGKVWVFICPTDDSSIEYTRQRENWDQEIKDGKVVYL